MLLHGRLEESQELLNLFARECQEDTNDIKLQLKETSNELEALDHKIKLQEH